MIRRSNRSVAPASLPPAEGRTSGYLPAQTRAEREDLAVDFAFADTVVAADLDDSLPPPSGIVVHDRAGSARHVLPIVFPPAGVQESDVTTRMRFALARVRHDMRDMHDLWDATAATEAARSARLPTMHRLRTLLSFFEWNRADLLRAAWMGIAVLVFVATLGALFVCLTSS